MTPLKILSVDDSIVIRRAYKNILPQILKNNIEFFEAGDGTQAFDVLGEHKDINIIFLDVNMPNMTGTEFLATLRKNKEYNGIRVIMSTTEAEKGTVVKIMKLGANGYIVKPFNKDTVKKAIEGVVGRMSGVEVVFV